MAKQLDDEAQDEIRKALITSINAVLLTSHGNTGEQEALAGMRGAGRTLHRFNKNDILTVLSTKPTQLPPKIEVRTIPMHRKLVETLEARIRELETELRQAKKSTSSSLGEQVKKKQETVKETRRIEHAVGDALHRLCELLHLPCICYDCMERGSRRRVREDSVGASQTGLRISFGDVSSFLDKKSMTFGARHPDGKIYRYHLDDAALRKIRGPDDSFLTAIIIHYGLKTFPPAKANDAREWFKKALLELHKLDTMITFDMKVQNDSTQRRLHCSIHLDDLARWRGDETTADDLLPIVIDDEGPRDEQPTQTNRGRKGMFSAQERKDYLRSIWNVPPYTSLEAIAAACEKEFEEDVTVNMVRGEGYNRLHLPPLRDNDGK